MVKPRCTLGFPPMLKLEKLPKDPGSNCNFKPEEKNTPQNNIRVKHNNSELEKSKKIKHS